ncbi:hypothetical protein AVEN_220275-1 [Araneus ventricosus]|uniref:Uncharacterized protein n=1 Tax=Araneus ventricosus TaxID=182803 RepID=A0A4Y2RFZ1_ARAVE|nr:hypothetical protein AVEN_220275-1 [Araneus ventricosus]
MSRNFSRTNLANERNKVRFIDLLKKFLQKANVTVKQAVEDADILIVETAASVKSQYDNIFVVGEGNDLLVLLTGLAQMKENSTSENVEKGGRLMCYTPQRLLNTNNSVELFCSFTLSVGVILLGHYSAMGKQNFAF